MGYAAVRPLVVRGIGYVRDHCGVKAFTSHGFGQVVHDKGAVLLVGKCLDIIMDIREVCTFMRDYHDAGIHSLLENRFQGFGVDRHHADRINALCDEVLYKLCLQRCVDFSGTLLVRVDPVLLCIRIHAGFHVNEPGIRGVLWYDYDFPVLLFCKACAQHREEKQRAQDQ